MGSNDTGKVVRREYAKDLVSHPSFEVPDFPKILVGSVTFDAIVKWTCGAVAAFVSPSPKEDDEDESFSCDDLARAIKEELPKILKVK